MVSDGETKYVPVPFLSGDFRLSLESLRDRSLMITRANILLSFTNRHVTSCFFFSGTSVVMAKTKINAFI